MFTYAKCFHTGCGNSGTVNSGYCTEHEAVMLRHLSASVTPTSPGLEKVGLSMVDMIYEGRAKPPAETMSAKYPKYYKDVSALKELDIYGVHALFDIQDPSGCIQHASKKLLLSGVRTGGKAKLQDITEARDTLNRWIAMNTPEA